MNFTSVNKIFEASFKKHWDRPVLMRYSMQTDGSIQEIWV